MSKHYSIYKQRRNERNKKDIKQFVPMKYSVIYEIRCVFNNRTYIGQTHDLTLRWNQHIAGNLAPQSFGHLTNSRLIKDVAEHGIEAFTFRILKRCFAMTEEERKATEQAYIDELKPYYNI